MILERNKSRQANLIIRNFKNAMAALSFIQKQYHNSQYLFSKIPHPIFNCVIDPITTKNEVEKTITHIWEDYQKNNLSHCWWISDLTEPSDFPQYLERLSFQKCPAYRGMHANLKKLKIELDTPSNIQIKKITHVDTFDTWIKPIAESFEFSKLAALEFSQCYKNLFERKKQFISYVALYEGNVAGSATLFLDNDSAGLYNGAVLPPLRNKGILTLLANTMLLEAKNQGFEDVITQVSDKIYNLSLRAGFKEYLQLQAYLSPTL